MPLAAYHPMTHVLLLLKAMGGFPYTLRVNVAREEKEHPGSEQLFPPRPVWDSREEFAGKSPLEAPQFRSKFVVERSQVAALWSYFVATVVMVNSVTFFFINDTSLSHTFEVINSIVNTAKFVALPCIYFYVLRYSEQLASIIRRLPKVLFDLKTRMSWLDCAILYLVFLSDVACAAVSSFMVILIIMDTTDWKMKWVLVSSVFNDNLYMIISSLLSYGLIYTVTKPLSLSLATRLDIFERELRSFRRREPEPRFIQGRTSSPVLRGSLCSRRQGNDPEISIHLRDLTEVVVDIDEVLTSLMAFLGFNLAVISFLQLTFTTFSAFLVTQSLRNVEGITLLVSLTAKMVFILVSPSAIQRKVIFYETSTSIFFVTIL